MIKLRFVNANTLINQAIRSAQLGFWASHVEAVTPQGTYLGAHSSYGVQNMANDYDKGVWVEQLVVPIPCTAEQEKTFYNFLYSQIGKPYDMDAIGEMLLGAITSQAPTWDKLPNKWICSALQAAALLKANIISSILVDPKTITPRDVLCICSGLTNIINKIEIK